MAWGGPRRSRDARGNRWPGNARCTRVSGTCSMLLGRCLRATAANPPRRADAPPATAHARRQRTLRPSRPAMSCVSFASSCRSPLRTDFRARFYWTLTDDSTRISIMTSRPLLIVQHTSSAGAGFLEILPADRLRESTDSHSGQLRGKRKPGTAPFSTTFPTPRRPASFLR